MVSILHLIAHTDLSPKHWFVFTDFSWHGKPRNYSHAKHRDVEQEYVKLKIDVRTSCKVVWNTMYKTPLKVKIYFIQVTYVPKDWRYSKCKEQLTGVFYGSCRRVLRRSPSRHGIRFCRPIKVAFFFYPQRSSKKYFQILEPAESLQKSKQTLNSPCHPSSF